MRYITTIILILCISTCEASNNQERNTKEPILLYADTINAEPDSEVYVAIGNVQVIQENEVLTADRLTYDKQTDTITATGNVILHKPNGDVIFAPYVQLKNEMKDGLITEMRALFTAEERMAANKGVRKAGTETQLDQVVYSACKICKQDPTKPPLWQFKSETALWDEEAHDIIYTDAQMEFMGYPVFYSPYFKHPDPNVKQRSGILTPEFKHSSDLGYVVAVPYYYVISPDKDVTIRPILTSERGIFLDTEYRQNFSNALLRLNGSIGKSEKLKQKRINPNANQTRDDAWRGHIDSTLDWHLNENWRIKGHALRSTDRTYLRQFPFYGYTDENVLTSRAEAEGFYGLNYIRTQGILYQGLRDGDRQSRIPVIAPVLDINYVSPQQFWGSRFFVDFNSLFLHRDEGTDVRRFSTDLTWSLPYTSAWGDHYNLSLKARGDIYSIHDFTPTGQTRKIDGTKSRFFPQMILEYDYPWFKNIKNGSITISPMASLVVAPNVGDQANFPNEDSFILEPTDMSLMRASRFPGLDRIDDGSRLNYGIKARARYKTDYRAEFFFGQSANLGDRSDVFQNTGFEKEWSDYVGRARVKITDYFNARYRFRMDRANFQLTRSELLTVFGPPILSAKVDFLRLPRYRGEVAGQGGKQISVGLSSAFAKGWNASVSTVRELGKRSHTLSQSASLTYENECLRAILNASRNFYVDQDLKPTKTILFVLIFKISRGQEVIGLRLNQEFDNTNNDKKQSSLLKSLF